MTSYSDVRVLMYHDTPEPGRVSGFNTAAAMTYKVEAGRFRQQVQTITHLLSVDSTDDSLWPAVMNGARAAVTFDDGGASNLVSAEVLEGFGIRGFYFVPTSLIGRAGFLTKGEIRELASAGHTVGTHTHSHPYHMRALPSEVIQQEIVTSIDRLEQILGEKITTGSVPGGSYSKRIGMIASDIGLDFLFTSRPHTRAVSVGRTRVIGRYAIRSNSADAEVVEWISGDFKRRAIASTSWIATSAARRIAPQFYRAVRGRLSGVIKRNK